VTTPPDPEVARLARLCIEDERELLHKGEIDLPTFRRSLRRFRRLIFENTHAPSRLASEGRALPYMGRRRSGQETNASP
jgi:hypothetical protein